VWREKDKDGERGVICSRARVSGGRCRMERETKKERRGGGACVGFVVYRSLSPDVRGNIFASFLWIEKEGGTDVDTK
jgi:hypothetical protein